jgi:hypothetical protein
MQPIYKVETTKIHSTSIASWFRNLLNIKTEEYTTSESLERFTHSCHKKNIEGKERILFVYSLNSRSLTLKNCRRRNLKMVSKVLKIIFVFTLVLSLITQVTMAAPPKNGGGGLNCSGVIDSRVDFEIHEIQGNGSVSPLEGKEVTTCGTVFAIASGSTGYWMQDTTEDGDPTTSEGLYVYGPNSGIAVGDVVSHTGTVTEYYGLTELSTRRQAKVIGSSNLPIQIELTSSMTYGELEFLEGMRVTVTSATVVAGSNKYNETFLVPGNTTSRVDRRDTTTPYFKIDDDLGRSITGASTFDTISGDPTGPLNYNFGAYTLLWSTGSVTVSDVGHTENMLNEDPLAI